jgi:hypothetical protein
MSAFEVFVWERDGCDELHVFDHTSWPPKCIDPVSYPKGEIREFCEEHGLLYRRLLEADDDASYHVVAFDEMQQVHFKMRFNVMPPMQVTWQEWYEKGRFFGLCPE